MMTRGANDKLARRRLFKVGPVTLSLADEAFLDDIVLNILKSGVPREKICFEITETALIPNLLWRRTSSEDRRCVCKKTVPKIRSIWPW